MNKQDWDNLEPGMWISNLKGKNLRQIITVYRKDRGKRVSYIVVPRLDGGQEIVIDRHYHWNYLICDRKFILV